MIWLNNAVNERFQLNTTHDERGLAVSEDVQHKLVQLCSLLAVVRMSAFALEATVETQMNVLWLAHDISIEVATMMGCIGPAISGC